jgi:hypothetical protein
MHSELLYFERLRPRNRRELSAWIETFLHLHMPTAGTCAGHGSPLDFLAHSFFEEPGDAVVWACRGGGKTTIGAVATLLDLLFKPGIQIRILGGSFEQSEKMYATLRHLTDRHFSALLKTRPTQRRLELRNGSRVEVLAQSDRSVRGQRVQKLRCDEVELFDPAVWQAAQLTTRSVGMRKGNGEPAIRGSVEVFSTMHKPGGLMQRILTEPSTGRRTFAWCVWDVIEKCPQWRECAQCPLWESCQGRAKSADGFVRIDDVIAMKSRVSQATWQHEMLCHPPRFENTVFPAFRRATHVLEVGGQPMIPGVAARVNGQSWRVESVVAGVDFGYAGAFVCLWMAMLRGANGMRAVWVLDELVTREQTLARNVEAMRSRPWEVSMVYCDVAGRHTNSQTGRTDECVLRDAGFATRCRAMPIEEGVGMIADLLDPASGGARLWIDPRCARLIAAFEGYLRRADGKPEKDGTHDHLIDALRYALVNHEGAGIKVEVRLY